MYQTATRSRARRTARRWAPPLTGCAAVAWWCCAGVVYTDAGVFFAGGAMVATSVLAAVAWVVSGE